MPMPTVDQANQIMSKKLVTVCESDSVRKAYQIMQERNIRHLPVDDGRGTIIGILSDRDVQRAVSPHSLQEFEINSKFRVNEFMNSPVQFVDSGATIQKVAEHILSHKVSAVLVRGTHDRAVGIVTTDDLIRYLVRTLKSDPLFSTALISDYVDEFGYWEQ